MTFDLVVRNGRVVVDGRVSNVDIGVEGGRVRVLQSGLAAAAIDIDANGRLVTPGGVDSHVHMGQLSSMGEMTANDFGRAAVQRCSGARQQSFRLPPSIGAWRWGRSSTTLWLAPPTR